MKYFGILLLTFITFSNCKSQVKYFSVTGINDITKPLIDTKAGWTSLNDKDRIDGYTRIGDSIFGGEIACNISPLNEIDIKTFKVYPGSKYAKDKYHVYYPLHINCVDYEDCGVCYYSKTIVEGANPLMFDYLGKDYATDGKRVFYRGNLLSNADGETFRIIDGPEYFYFAVDKQYVFSHDEIFKDADPKSFYYDNLDMRNDIVNHIYVIGDKDNKWEFVPPEQFKKIDKN